MSENNKAIDNKDTEEMTPSPAVDLAPASKEEVEAVRKRLIEQDKTAVRSPERKREIIKTVLIIFLAGLLILTFFSNTIMNKSLPEISTDTVTSGKLTERVRGSGMIESNQSYDVTTDGNYTIDTINIKTGQEVKKDDVLFVLNGSGSEELTAMEEDLAALELEYEKALLESPADFAEEKRAVRDARIALQQAIEKRDSVLSSQSSDAQAKEQLKKDKAEAKRLTTLQTKLSSTISAIDMDDYSGAAPELIGNLASMLSNYRAAESAYTEAYALYSQAVEEGADESVVNAALSDAGSKESVRDQTKIDYDNAKSGIRYDLAAQLASTEAALEAVNDRLEESAEGSIGDGMTYEECVADVEIKQNALDDATAALEKAQAADKVLTQQQKLEMDAKKKKIDSQKAEIEKRKAKSGKVEVKAKYDGVVSSINVQPSDTTAPEAPLAVIDLAQEGYTVRVEVSQDKAKKLKKGVKAEVLNNWNSSAEAVLKDIKNSSGSSGTKTLVFDITGDVDSGTFIELSIPCGSGNYDTIVPKSALKSDSSGSFVLAVKSKSSPLGNRYYAEKIKVEVLASDESSSAVQGSISSGTYIITAASKPVSAGDQVRMQDK